MSSEEEQAKKNFLDLGLLGLAYIESRIFGDGDVADEMEKTYPAQELISGVTAMASSFVVIASDGTGVPPKQIIENVRQSMLTIYDNDEQL